MEVADADPGKVEAVDVDPAATTLFDWFGICTRKSDDTEPTESELALMEPFFPKLRNILFNVKINQLKNYAPARESRVMDNALMFKFGRQCIFKRLAPRGCSDPTLVKGAGYNRNTDMMFVYGGCSSNRDKFTETAGGKVYWRIFTEAHGEYHGAKVGSPAKDRLTREGIVTKLALEFHTETGGWFLSL